MKILIGIGKRIVSAASCLYETAIKHLAYYPEV